MLLDSGLLVLMIVLVGKSHAFRPTALVTGSTDGIGLTTAKNLARKGFNVIVHGRDANRIESACQAIHSFVGRFSKESVSTFTVKADLSTIQGSRSLAEQVALLCEEHDLRLSVLMNNAGVYSERHITTPDGLELTFAVNVMGPFVITSHLLPTLLKQPKSRIVTASSMSQCYDINDWDDLQFSRRAYSAHRAYSESKLFDAMLAAEFAERLQGAGLGTDRITSNSLDPGTVNTKMLIAGWGYCGIGVDQALGKHTPAVSEI